MELTRRARDRGKQSMHRVFRWGQRAGVDILPRHFYSSVPDLRALEDDDSWRRASEMPGVRGTDLDEQLAELSTWFTPAVRERLRVDAVHADAVRRNGGEEGYGPMESQVLYAFVATRRPSHVVQVGAGVSTAVILAAADHHDVDVTITCVDPYPTELLEQVAEDDRVRLVREPAQTVAMETFTQLAHGDLLFVDSTHTVKVGSEVNRLVLEVLPRLTDGVVVQFHDVMFPYDYPVDLLDGRFFFWNESTLLQAFLAGNDRARILASGSMLHHARREDLRRLLVGYRPANTVDGLFADGVEGHFPSATWFAIG